MLVVFAAVALVVVFVIAAVVIGRESNRLSVEAPRPVFDLEEAVVSVADMVPFEVSAVLSHDDVRRLLRWNLADLQEAAAMADDAAGDGDSLPRVVTVMGEDEAVEAVRTRAHAEGLEYTDDQILAVIDAHLAYLKAIGAAGPAEVDERSVEERKTTGDPVTGGDTMTGPEKGGGPAEQTL